MYGQTTRRAMLLEMQGQSSLNQLSKRFGISRSTLRAWRDTPFVEARRRHDCPRCDPTRQLDRNSYAHLLGLDLGDDCTSAMKKGSPDTSVGGFESR